MSVTDIHCLLVRAIKERRYVSFNYQSLDRVVVCALLGLTNEGNLAVRAYQIEGKTDSGRTPVWRNFLLSEMNEVSLGERYSCISLPGYFPSDTSFSRIDASL
ncbi:hypothetical protein [Turicimonas sp. TL08]